MNEVYPKEELETDSCLNTITQVRASRAINILVLKNGRWKDGRSRDVVQNTLM